MSAIVSVGCLVVGGVLMFAGYGVSEPGMSSIGAFLLGVGAARP